MHMRCARLPWEKLNMVESDDPKPEQVGPAGLWKLWKSKRRSGEGMDSIIQNLREQEASQQAPKPPATDEAANDAGPVLPTR